MNLFQILLQSLKAKFTPIVTRFRYYFNPAYWLTLGIEAIRNFFTKVLNVRPRNKDDYYPMGRWLVSKRLCFAIVVVIGVLSVMYIYAVRSTLFPQRADGAVKTYSYNSVLLKFAKGMVRIKGKSGYLAYEGQVSDGSCNGTGTLMNPDGIVVYQGNFEKSMYEAMGTQYYQDGMLWYTGGFHENLHSGDGKLYRPNGTLEYAGQFAMDMKEGDGTLYDMSNNPVYTGRFSHDEILYSNLIGKTNTEVAAAYTGERKMYVSGMERVRFLPDIEAMTVEITDDESIDTDAKVDSVYVLKKAFKYGNHTCQTISSLTDVFGAPVYVGTSYATLPEALAINFLYDRRDLTLDGPVEMTENDVFTEYTEVEDYDREYEVYLHTYHRDGLIYTFVSNRGSDVFDFYFIHTESLSDVAN